MDKIRIENCFRSQDIVKMADLVAVRIEETCDYYILKSRNTASNSVVNEEQLRCIINNSKLPVILSDRYANIESYINGKTKCGLFCGCGAEMMLVGNLGSIIYGYQCNSCGYTIKTI